MMLRQIAILLLSVTALLMTGTARAETLNVSLVLSDGSPPYRQFADAFRRALGASKTDVTVTETRDVRGSAGLIVTIGMMASELAVTQSKTPVLAVMIPENGLQALLEQPSRQLSARLISAIYLNQPINRQLDFLQAAFPERRKIGLLHTPDTLIDIAELRRQVANRGGVLVARQVTSAEKLFPSLEIVFAGSDLLLASPDSEIYNNNNIRNILLTSYRKGIPLVGLSQSYVNAGALCAVFTTMEQMAGQAVAMVNSFAKKGRLPEPQHPAEFTVAVNTQVARSLGIEMQSPEAIKSLMVKNALRE